MRWRLVGHQRLWRIRRKFSRLGDLRKFIPISGYLLAVLHYSLWSYIFWFIRLKTWSAEMAERASSILSEMLERMQKAYFTSPWFSDLTISLVEAAGRAASRVMRLGIRCAIAFNIGDKVRLSKVYHVVPRDGYKAFMGAYLALGEAAGYFRGREIHVLPVVLSNKKVDLKKRHYIDYPPLTRLEAPTSISEALLDIDDIYWNSGKGMPVKIIHVGDERHRGVSSIVKQVNRVFHRRPRWIVVLTGTDHISGVSNTNPADTQTNLSESIDHKSLVRQGVEKALREAMAECGIVREEDMGAEDVLIIGHSQGALVAMQMINDPTLPFRICAVVSAGGPIGRLDVPDNVTVVALRHRQDAIPAFGGYHGEEDPKIVVLERSLSMPQSGVLYYAHSASTYAETAQLLEGMVENIPNSRIGRAIKTIDSMFPASVTAKNFVKIAEPSRVFIYELIQQVEPDATSAYIRETILENASRRKQAKRREID